MDKVFKELQMTILVEDPLAYVIDKRIYISIIERKYNLLAFYEGSYADKNIDTNYWRKVTYSHLSSHTKNLNKLVWYQFIGKHIQIVS